MTRDSEKQRGYALITVMGVVVACGITFGAMADRVRATVARTAFERARIETQAGLDAGISLARYRLGQSTDWDGDSIELDDVEVRVRVKERGVDRTIVRVEAVLQRGLRHRLGREVSIRHRR